MATIKNVKVAEKLVEKLFYQRCTGIQIPAMKLGTLNKIGVQAVLDGKTEKEIGDLLYEKAVAFGKGL